MIHMSGDQVMVTDRVTSSCPWRVVVRDDARRCAPPKAMRSSGLYGGRHQRGMALPGIKAGKL